jgi:localization factor PodJL
MHNLAVDYLEGKSGPSDPKSAIRWFERAAHGGVVDSNYNLGALYEQGVGVASDPAKALIWYKRAAAAGDHEAQLRVSQLTAASRPASAAPPLAASVIDRPAPNDQIRATQRQLASAGYYIGPIDGQDTPAFRSALATFERETDLRGRADGPITLWPK